MSMVCTPPLYQCDHKMLVNCIEIVVSGCGCPGHALILFMQSPAFAREYKPCLNIFTGGCDLTISLLWRIYWSLVKRRTHHLRI